MYRTLLIRRCEVRNNGLSAQQSFRAPNSSTKSIDKTLFRLLHMEKTLKLIISRLVIQDGHSSSALKQVRYLWNTSLIQ